MKKGKLTDNLRLMSFFDFYKNKNLDVNKLTEGQACKVWWKCEFNHSWQSRIADIANGIGCPYCSRQKGSLIDKHPKFVQYWHTVKNGVLTPSDEFSFKKQKVWWKCPFADDHEWQTTVNLKRGCPFCSGNKTCNSNCLTTTHPDLAKEWHPIKNFPLKPDDVTAGSHKKVWWKCPISEDHEWESIISKRTDKSRNKLRGCPCCSGKKLVLSNCVATKFPNLLLEFDFVKNTNKTLYDVTFSSSEKFHWLCKKGHSWQSSISVRCSGCGCPECKNSKGENRVRDYLLKNNIDYMPQYNFGDNKLKMRADFMVTSKRVCVIEYNGGQHYFPVHFGSKSDNAKEINFAKNIKRDQIKIDYCRKNNIELLIIPYWDFDRIEEILDCWFNNEEVVFSEEPEIVKKYKKIGE
jgi:hypothetical protein